MGILDLGGGTFLISRLCLEVYKGRARLLPPCKLGFQRAIPHWLLRSLSWGKVKVDRQLLSGQLAVSTWTEEGDLRPKAVGEVNASGHLGRCFPRPKGQEVSKAKGGAGIHHSVTSSAQVEKPWFAG